MNKEFQAHWTGLSAEKKRELSERTEIAVCYLSQVAHGHRRAGRKTIERLVNADPNIHLNWFFSQ